MVGDDVPGPGATGAPSDRLVGDRSQDPHRRPVGRRHGLEPVPIVAREPANGKPRAALAECHAPAATRVPVGLEQSCEIRQATGPKGRVSTSASATHSTLPRTWRNVAGEQSEPQFVEANDARERHRPDRVPTLRGMTGHRRKRLPLPAAALLTRLVTATEEPYGGGHHKEDDDRDDQLRVKVETTVSDGRVAEEQSDRQQRRPHPGGQGTSGGLFSRVRELPRRSHLRIVVSAAPGAVIGTMRSSPPAADAEVPLAFA